MNWRDYHEWTKHTAERLRRSPHFLDWANMPDPFREYEGAPVLDLPADPPVPEEPALEVLLGTPGATPAVDGAALLSELLFYSAAVSASKVAPSGGYRYALRVNPSSGNLHPTEFHFASSDLKDWPDGLYHYRSSEHVAEQRAEGDVGLPGTAPLVFVLTSIAWREAWKYRDRAYRYCLHDIGHAWQALALAARAMGYDTAATGEFDDDAIAKLCGLPEDEWPMLLLEFRSGFPAGEGKGDQAIWHGGRPNRLSEEKIAYPKIDAMHHATKRAHRPVSCVEASRQGSGELRLPPPVLTAKTFGEVVRSRRSALDFVGGDRFLSQPQLATLLRSASQPFTGDFGDAPFISLYLYVHRVEGLVPGVYRYWPATLELERVRTGDQRVVAAGLSLGQDLAGNACVAFSMIADLERATRAFGDRGYRYVHFEAGAAGQRLYLAAEALGVRATGIGAFYDDEVHRYLGLTPEDGQVVYHFAIGYPVADPRLDA